MFAQAVARLEGAPAAGAELEICDARGTSLGRGLYSPGSAIIARVFSRDPAVPVDAALFEQRLSAAVARRRDLGLPSGDTTGFRVVHAEGDGLPGLVVDRLGEVLAVQWGSIGLWQRREVILDLLERLLSPRAIVDRSSERTAKQEGFVAQSGIVRGSLDVQELDFFERGLRFVVPLSLGQKTGFYFDQRPLRARVEALSRDRRVLDTYCYAGAMALAAARGGAREVVAVDTSAPALEVARRAAVDNGFGERIHCVESDALAELGRAQGRFDLVICDPPKLAPSRSARGRAADVLRRVARAANEAARDGGLVVLSSCSAALGIAELTRALALGARDAGREARVFERIFQGPDHPVPAAFPEGWYLSSVIAESLCSRASQLE